MGACSGRNSLPFDRTLVSKYGSNHSSSSSLWIRDSRNGIPHAQTDLNMRLASVLPVWYDCNRIRCISHATRQRSLDGQIERERVKPGELPSLESIVNVPARQLCVRLRYDPA